MQLLKALHDSKIGSSYELITLRFYLISTQCVHVNTVKAVNRESFSGNEGRNV